jgi:ribosome-binding factor A
MKSNNRLVRINEEFQKEITQIIRTELKDPRVATMTTVMNVEVTPDLKYAKIFISVLGNTKQKDEAIEGLKNASGFIRKELARRVNLRNTPQLSFVLDESVEYAIKMSKLIEEVNKTSNTSSGEEK